MIWQETAKLLDYLPTNPYDWQWRTCSDGHITPAQKPNGSIMCNSFQRVYLYGFQTYKDARSLNATYFGIRSTPVLPQ